MAEPFGPEGLPLEQARALILAALQPLGGNDTLPLGACLGRISAAAVLAREAVPGFRASLMDGYAIAGETIPAPGSRWTLVGVSAPGAPHGGRLGPGQAIRILTGAPVPEGSGKVLPQELVELASDGLLGLVRDSGPNPWIRQPNEEAAPGQLLLGAGQRLGPADLGRLASCGVAAIAVTRRPRLGLLISGDDLLPPALQQLEGGQVQLLPRLRVRLEAPLRRGGGRPELARAALVVGPQGELLARVGGSQASSRIGSLQGADLLLEIPAELDSLEAGQELWAQLLRLPIF